MPLSLLVSFRMCGMRGSERPTQPGRPDHESEDPRSDVAPLQRSVYGGSGLSARWPTKAGTTEAAVVSSGDDVDFDKCRSTY